jgi:transglutaminase-like putative cysteine protease
VTAATVSRRTKPVDNAQPMYAHVPATIALTMLTAVTAISLCRVFPDWAYLRPMLVVCFGVHAVMLLFRVLRVTAWVAVPGGLIALAVLIGLIYFRGSTRFGIPTGATIDQFRISMRLVWRQFPHAVAPVPSEGSFAIAATTALALCAWLADSFAFRAFGRAEAVVPTGVVFVFTSALGVDRNRILVAALWVGAAILTIAALRMAHTRDDSAWMGKRRQSLWSALPAAVACALFATTGAVAVAPQLPGAGDKALLDTRNRDGNVFEVVSPLVDIRSRIVNKGNVELFTVKTDTPRYLALTALGQFDGTRWSTLPEDTRVADGILTQQLPNSAIVQEQITIKKLGGQLAPAARSATAATWQGPSMLWANESGALYVDGGLKPGYQYQITSANTDPTDADLRTATVDNPPNPAYYDLPKSLPAEVSDLAQQITAGATTPYDKALAIQNYFRANFTYDIHVQRGHSNDAMLDFLNIKKGYCEQFSGTFAAMARVVGLPTRVMVGFTPGILRSDGLYHVAGRHAHAWDEVWFDGFGWQMFDPTPGRGAPGAERHTGEQAAQDTSNGTPGGTIDESQPTPTFQPPLSQRPSAENTPATGSTTPRKPLTKKSDGSPRGLIIAAILLLILAWFVGMPRVLNRWSRRRVRDPADRVTSAWAATVRSLTMAGAPRVGGSTPLEYAKSVDVGKAETVEIARLVTRAVYSPRGVDNGAADRSELLRSEVDAACRVRMSMITRLLDHLDPRSAWGRITG